MRRLIQLIPSHHLHDAAGSESLVIESLLREAGWQVETYAAEIDEELRGRTRPSEELDGAELDNAVALYHYCAASEMTVRFAELDCPKVIIYHNITPHRFFEPYDPDLVIDCREGRKQLKAITDSVDLAIGHSEFSRLELEGAGFDVTRTVPYLFDAAKLRGRPDAAMMDRLADMPVVLFVGRLVPNKAPGDFIRVAAAYAREDWPPVRFVIAGKRNVIPSYLEEINGLIGETGLGEDRLLLTGEITQEELIACYRCARLFLSLSKHEGFMVPLLESMFFYLPILARADAAVPETLGDAGLLLESADPKEIAGKVFLLLSDESQRAELARRGRRRLARYDLQRWGFVLRVLLEQLLG